MHKFSIAHTTSRCPGRPCVNQPHVKTTASVTVRVFFAPAEHSGFSVFSVCVFVELPSRKSFACVCPIGFSGVRCETEPEPVSLVVPANEIKTFVLILVLMRAGLGLKLSDVRKSGITTVALFVAPYICELLTEFALVKSFLQWKPLEIALMCSIFASLSPSLVIPAMLKVCLLFVFVQLVLFS